MATQASRSSESSLFDNLYSTTREAVLPDIREQVYESNPTVAKLNEAGNIIMQDGGTQIDQVIQTAENTTVKSYAPGGSFDTSDQELFTRAQYQFRYLGGTVATNREEERRNSGESQIHDLVAAKIEAMVRQLTQELNKQLLATVKVNPTDLEGIFLAVPSDPSAPADYAGFNSSTDLFWRSQIEDATAITSRINLIGALLNLSVNCQLGGSGAPNFYVTDPTTWQYFAQNMQTLVRIGDKNSANVGFDSVDFRGAPLFFDKMMPDLANGINFPDALTEGTILAGNSKAMKLVVDTQSNPADLGWTKTPANPTVRSRAWAWMGNLVTIERRALGAVKGISQTAITI